MSNKVIMVWFENDKTFIQTVPGEKKSHPQIGFLNYKKLVSKY